MPWPHTHPHTHMKEPQNTQHTCVMRPAKQRRTSCAKYRVRLPRLQPLVSVAVMSKPLEAEAEIRARAKGATALQSNMCVASVLPVCYAWVRGCVHTPGCNVGGNFAFNAHPKKRENLGHDCVLFGIAGLEHLEQVLLLRNRLGSLNPHHTLNVSKNNNL